MTKAGVVRLQGSIETALGRQLSGGAEALLSPWLVFSRGVFIVSARCLCSGFPTRSTEPVSGAQLCIGRGWGIGFGLPQEMGTQLCPRLLSAHPFSHLISGYLWTGALEPWFTLSLWTSLYLLVNNGGDADSPLSEALRSWVAHHIPCTCRWALKYSPTPFTYISSFLCNLVDGRGWDYQDRTQECWEGLFCFCAFFPPKFSGDF